MRSQSSDAGAQERPGLPLWPPSLCPRGRSSIGRAPALQAGGRRFDPVRLHFAFLGRGRRPGRRVSRSLPAARSCPHRTSGARSTSAQGIPGHRSKPTRSAELGNAEASLWSLKQKSRMGFFVSSKIVPRAGSQPREIAVIGFFGGSRSEQIGRSGG